MCCTWENSCSVEIIVMLFKKGDPLNLENYRPIANLNHLSKIYEKLILDRVWAMMGDSLPSNPI